MAEGGEDLTEEAKRQTEIQQLGKVAKPWGRIVMFRKASATWNLGSELALDTWQPLTQGEPDSRDHLEPSSRGQARSTRPSTKWRALGNLEHRLF